MKSYNIIVVKNILGLKFSLIKNDRSFEQLTETSKVYRKSSEPQSLKEEGERMRKSTVYFQVFMSEGKRKNREKSCKLKSVQEEV